MTSIAIGTSTPTSSDEHASIQQYYSEVLHATSDLKTSACCCAADALPAQLRPIAGALPAEVTEKFYGCGSPIPMPLAGCTVLDLGCGTGRDAFLLASLVGKTGRVIGVDMTAEQLDVAQRHEAAVAELFGYSGPNTRFVQGYLEDLAACGIEDGSVDVVVSNCVINLVRDKKRVFAEVLRVLKPGGEMVFSDVFADRRCPEGWRRDPVLLGECLAGAMYVEDFRRMLAENGVRDYRTLSRSPIGLNNPDVEAKVGMVNFTSETVRFFKSERIEDRCEDYGQSAIYLGSVPGQPHRYTLDEDHVFETQRPMRICGNTAAMLEETRLAAHFVVTGDRSRHFGLFPCGEPKAKAANPVADGGCC